MISIAHAMGQSGAAQGGGFQAFIPIILMFAIFYFLLIRPQQKKAKEHKNMVSSLKKGDRIITSGGIHGKVTSLDNTTVMMEIAEKVRIKVTRNNITGVLNETGSQTKIVEKPKS